MNIHLNSASYPPCIFHVLLHFDFSIFPAHYESLLYLEKIGFNVNPVKIFCKDIKEAIKAIEKIGEDRPEIPFGIDGAVIKVDNLELREKIGTTFKTPKWAIAYKYPPEQKETILKEIIVM